MRQAIQQLLMKENREARASVARLADAEIASAIRYLDPECPQGIQTVDSTDTVLMICFSFIILLGGALGFVLLYLQAS